MKTIIETIEDYFNNCKQSAVKAEIGSMILWDSRTFHQGIGSSINRNKENFRMVIYITMMPKSTIKDPKTIIKKQRAFRNLKLTSHWANYVFTFPKKSEKIIGKQ